MRDVSPGLLAWGRFAKQNRSERATGQGVFPQLGSLKQLVEIAAGLSHRCRVLILDEPTAALTVADTERLFVQIRKLQQTEIDKDIGKSRRSRRRLL